MMKFSNSLSEYALKNNLHVEYFIWVYLRNLHSAGLYDVDDLNKPCFKSSTFMSKLKDNLFFKVKGNKIITTSIKNIPVKLGSRHFEFDFMELNKFARKITTGSSKTTKGWNSTTAKYLLICVIACQYDREKPYALDLISADTGYSVSTIQRALKNLMVDRVYVPQENPSPRSYYGAGGLVNLSPNYNILVIGQRFGPTSV